MLIDTNTPFSGEPTFAILRKAGGTMNYGEVVLDANGHTWKPTMIIEQGKFVHDVGDFGGPLKPELRAWIPGSLVFITYAAFVSFCIIRIKNNRIALHRSPASGETDVLPKN